MSADRPRPETLDLIRTLVAFPTVSRDSNLGLIEWVRDRLARRGVAARLTWDAERRKANLFATLGEGDGGLVLSGHTDVVPVEGQDWSHDPFDAIEREGRLYGRGVADMKGFIGVVLARLDGLLQAAARGRPIHLALSYDEEVGCLGVRGLIADLAQAGIRPEGCIVGEPTGMRVVLGHKGLDGWRCRVHGKSAHSSLAPHAVNAVEAAAELVVRVAALGRRLRDTETRDPVFDVPHSTLSTGKLDGGVAINVVPREAEFLFECRTLPGTAPDALFGEIRDYAFGELLPRMRAIAPEASIAFEQVAQLPPFRIAPDAALVRFAESLRDGADVDAAGRHVAFGTEAGLFQQAGIPTVVCGPGHIAQAHTPDEWVALEQLAHCERFVARLAAAAHFPGIPGAPNPSQT